MATHTTRGRPRKFDQTQVLDDAVDLFWDKGYKATTTRDLERVLGITQSSLYNAFGSKRDLLLRAVDRYEERITEELFHHLDGGGYRSLRGFFEELARWVQRNEHRGCMVVNLMAGENDDERILERVQAYRDKIRTGMATALSGVADLDDATRRTRSELLLAAVLGLHVTARTARGPAEVDAMAAAICAQIDAWDQS